MNEGQFMIIVEQGAIVDACGEAGEFVFDKSTEPSLFFGESGTLGDRIKKSFERVGARFSLRRRRGQRPARLLHQHQGDHRQQVRNGPAGAVPRGGRQHRP